MDTGSLGSETEIPVFGLPPPFTERWGGGEVAGAGGAAAPGVYAGWGAMPRRTKVPSTPLAQSLCAMGK